MKTEILACITLSLYNLFLFKVIEMSIGIPIWLRATDYAIILVVVVCFVYSMFKRKVIVYVAALEWLRSHTGEYANEIHKYITGTAKK